MQRILGSELSKNSSKVSGDSEGLPKAWGGRGGCREGRLRVLELGKRFKRLRSA